MPVGLFYLLLFFVLANDKRGQATTFILLFAEKVRTLSSETGLGVGLSGHGDSAQHWGRSWASAACQARNWNGNGDNGSPGDRLGAAQAFWRPPPWKGAWKCSRFEAQKTEGLAVPKAVLATQLRASPWTRRRPTENKSHFSS